MANLVVKVKMLKLVAGSKLAPQRPRSYAGFTLIEMLVVLTILALMMVVVVPSVSRGLTTTVSDVARDIQISLRKARSNSVTQQKSVAFIVDTQNREYQIYGQTTMRLPDDIELTVKAAESEVRNSQAAMRFYPDGSSTGGRLTVQQGDEQIVINVDWLTGRVTTLQ